MRTAMVWQSLFLTMLLGEALGMSLTRHSAPAPGTGKTAAYFWASGRGAVGRYSASESRGPRELSNATLAWTWHSPAGRYFNSPVGANIDGERNIYLTSLNGIRKFSPDGTVLWVWAKQPNEELPDTASIYEGALYCSTTAGRIFALDMETGKELWVTKLPSTDLNNGWVTAHEGVVITGADSQNEPPSQARPGMCDQVVTGLNATDGEVLWNFKPVAPLWNFAATFAGDGTFGFQDYEARAYRCRISDGTPLWVSGGVQGSWTDGSALLGPNRVLYTVGNLYGMGGRDKPGVVSAYKYSDGSLLWSTKVPQPPNNMPAIGRLAGRRGLSLVQPIGQQCIKGNPTGVYALDAETGEVQWIFDGPMQSDDKQMGDNNPVARMQRKLAGVRPITLPNPWSAPSIDGKGTVFIGSQEGPLFALRDTNGDGVIAGEEEVSAFDTKACFGGSSSPAIADGMLVAASIDALYVFKS